MKKVFIILTVLFCVIMLSFSLYYQKTQKVLLVAELTGFKIENFETEDQKTDNVNTIKTSLKQLGIVTYINAETNQFAALGHSLIDSPKGTDINGECYNVKFEGTYANLEESKNLGNIYLNEEEPIGTIYYDSYTGIYGKINNLQEEKYEEIETENRYHIKTGKANILIRLDGINLESYEVEILAINYIAKNKNIRIKITDKRLIEATGGIVQGMSGTPVIQNGKLIGAINCVSIDSPQDAYAIFIDKLL